MFFVFVKHYLTQEGVHYFDNEWFPRVHSIMSQHDGFISLDQEKQMDRDDCVNITLKFKDRTTFDSWWKAFPEHDKLVDMLDSYRSRDYWEAVATEDPLAVRSDLEWTLNKPRTIPGLISPFGGQLPRPIEGAGTSND